MTHEEKIAAIREACIAANPTKEWEYTEQDGSGRYYKVVERCRLADVLLALQSVKHWRITRAAQFSIPQGRLRRGAYVDWNLRNDNLTAQSPECIDFLFELFPNPQP